MDNKKVRVLRTHITPLEKKRVCAYTRVSTNKEEQLTSIHIQTDYYLKHIVLNSEWEFAGIFIDQGKTGTTTKNRTQFLLMIEMCRMGQIDIILTKSVSRFARNVIDALSISKEPRNLGVEIIFENDNLSSFDSSFDFYLTTLASVAEEESRANSNNVKWSNKRRMLKGLDYTNHLYGYIFNKEVSFVINSYEAKWVKFIFDKYLEGWTTRMIVDELFHNKVKTSTGNLVWRQHQIKEMLKNEKYVGDLLLQKSVTVNIGSPGIKNNNIKDKYYVKNNHPGIISREQFNKVQEILEQRRIQFNAPIGRRTIETPFARFIYSLEANKYLKRKYAHKNTKYEVKIYTLDNFANSGFKYIFEEQLRIALESAATALKNALPLVKDKSIEYEKQIIRKTNIETKINKCLEKINTLTEQIKELLLLNDDSDNYAVMISKLQNELIELECEFVGLKHKKVMECTTDLGYARLVKNLKALSIKSLSDYKNIFEKVIAINRENLVFVVRLTNKEFNENEFHRLATNEPIQEGTYYYKKSRIKLNVNWNIIFF